MRKRIDEDASWEVVGGTSQTPLVLQYNDPFQPPWKMRNEVCLVVTKKQAFVIPKKVDRVARNEIINYLLYH